MSNSNKNVNIYCLYDTVSKEKMPIFQMSSDDVSKRNVVKLNTKGSIEFPDDLHLCRLGYIELEDYSIHTDYKDLGSISEITKEFYQKSVDIGANKNA